MASTKRETMEPETEMFDQLVDRGLPEDAARAGAVATNRWWQVSTRGRVVRVKPSDDSPAEDQTDEAGAVADGLRAAGWQPAKGGAWEWHPPARVAPRRRAHHACPVSRS